MKKSNRHHHHHHHHILLHLLIIPAVLASAADDSAAIHKIASGFRNAPKGWSSTSTNNYCNWQGISCDKSSRVNYISLASKSVSGTLAPEIADLSELRSVSLQRNSLSGNIPSFGTLSNLQDLFLDSNGFSSITPNAFDGLSSIQRLSLSENPKLGPWTFPNVSKLTTIVELEVSNTNIYGTLPDIFGSLSSLQSIRASYNNMNGTLPASLGGSMIQNLWLNNQNTGYGFTGTLAVLSNMTQLAQVWVHVNSFTGPIPDLSKCTSLFDLQIRDNQLTGPVPKSLLNLSSLKNVSLDNNKLQGPFPVFPNTVEKARLNGSNNFCNTDGAPCDPQVSTLIEIAGGFGYPVLLSDSWDGNDVSHMSFITSDSNKRVITVNLANKGLSGKISPAFGDLKSLKNLNLNDNNLTGEIPDNLTELASLQLLDVSDNDLSGDIPKFPSSVKFIYSGNTLLVESVNNSGGGSVSPSSSSGGGTSSSGGGSAPASDGNSTNSSSKVAKGKTSKALIVGIAVGGAIFLAVICFVSCIFIMKKKDREHGKMDKNIDAEKGAVKSAITSVGKTDTDNQSRASSDQSNQNLFEGGNVAISIESFIHRDLKPSNILLGDDMRAKVADFGLVRNAPDGKHSLETRLAGTFGYLAPEYATTGRVTTKVDVYAFGVVLMELITGRKALDGTLAEEKMHLVTWFRRVLINKDEVLKLVDQTIKFDEENDGDGDGETKTSILKVAELAGHCTIREPSQRPDMGHAVNVLSPLVQQWKPKPTSQEEDEPTGIDLELSLSQALQRWQMTEGDTSTFGDTSLYDTQMSISMRPSEPCHTSSSNDTRR
ncbi:hypothetical protein V6N13_060501 [Hibiscus sabdariffa]